MNPVIEGLRATGALMVLTHHYTYQLSEDLATFLFGLHFFHNGVDLFFVITGYLFAPFLLNEKTVVAKLFLKRRFFRLYPLYLLSLLTFTLLATTSLPELSLWVEHLFLLQSLPYHTIVEAGSISLVYWTLATELQFYFFVLLMSLFYRYFHIKNKPLLLLILSLVGFFVSVYAKYEPRSGYWVLWQAQLPALLLEFFFGVVVFIYLAKLSNFKLRLVVFSLGLLVLSLLYYYYPEQARISLSARPFAWFNVLSAAGYACIMAAALAWYQSKLCQVKCSRCSHFAIFLGGLSYAVYLFHEIVVRWFVEWGLSGELSVLCAFIVTLGLAWAINRWVEIPFRIYGRRVK